MDAALGKFFQNWLFQMAQFDFIYSWQGGQF
jgi:hypothetical protein